MRNLFAIFVTIATLTLVAAHATAALINYEGNDNALATNNWFPTTDPVAGDLAETATVTLVQGTTHALSGAFGNLTNGSGGTGVTTTSWFSQNGNPGPAGVDKIQMDFGSNELIGSVKTFSWQDFDTNDRRFPQIYQLYGSTAVSPATSDAALATPTWSLLATVDSTTEFAFDGRTPASTYSYEPTPEQLAVTITGDSGSNLGAYRHLLFRITVAPDPDGGGVASTGFSPFWSEIDVIAGVPEPSSSMLAIAGAFGLILRRRQKRLGI